MAVKDLPVVKFDPRTKIIKLGTERMVRNPGGK